MADTNRNDSTLARWSSDRSTDMGQRFLAMSDHAIIAGSGSSRLLDSIPPTSPKSTSVFSLSTSQIVSPPSTRALSELSTATTETVGASTISEGTSYTVPSLSNGSSALSTIYTDTLEPTPILGVRLLEPDGVELADNAVASPDYPCLFFFLNCSSHTRDKETWKTHCLTHFRGRSPPKTPTCPLCDVQFDHPDIHTRWNDKMEHIADHLCRGDTLASGRPDFALFKYLWAQRLISDTDYQELMGNYHLSVKTPNHCTVIEGQWRQNRITRRGASRLTALA
ncbi:hypothetical protein EJ08DRAFT_90159 [Tothia fuscella]|uniref:Uncharacterized protein n=1 Tax=Tothia fuscella TaxID=1048955 RepID=A0A9P4NXX3_9PEZI|nr:hypothetical protein EJ08DRAFT_90159 [Tothia fuscella]